MPGPIGERWPHDWGFKPREFGNKRQLQSITHVGLTEPEPAPVISQLHQDTFFDKVNCGPTCMVMAGVAWGTIPRSASVKGAIMAAGKWGRTSQNGTSPYGMGEISTQMNLDFEQTPFIDAAGLRHFLEAGAHVVVRGNSFQLPWADDYEPDLEREEVQEPGEAPFSAHVVYVVGEDEKGFIVHDPYLTDGGPRRLKANELESFGAPKDYRDKPFMMAVGKSDNPNVEVRKLRPGEKRPPNWQE